MNDVEVHELVTATARSARVAQRNLARAPRATKGAASEAMVYSLIEYGEAILVTDAADLERGRQGGMKPGFLDRLALDSGWLSAIADSLREMAVPPDPVGQVVDDSVMPNGSQVCRVQVPLGVIDMIYETRPNVTVDIVALAVESGNAIILHGGSAAQNFNVTIVMTLRSTLEAQGLPVDLVTSIDADGRDGTRAPIHAHGLVDALVSRGGAGLIRAAVEQSIVPAVGTRSGNCHIYADVSADLEAAMGIIANTKTQYIDMCSTVETFLVYVDIAAAYLPTAARALWGRDTVPHAGPTTHWILTETATTAGRDILLAQAAETDWDTEYGSLDLAIRVMKSLEEAIDCIRAYTAGHTETVLAQDISVINGLIAGMDSTAVTVNASTRFAGGGQLGLGVELGIPTQKLHARGPVGLNELTTTTQIVERDGHIRP